MTAPTPQPDAERVQGEVTAAVERAARKYANLTGSGMESALRVTPHALAAALDVEEMARAGYEAHPLKDCAWANVPDTIRRWHIAEATAIRAAILGGAA